MLVERFAARWGVEREAGGTCVWFEQLAAGAPSAPPERGALSLFTLAAPGRGGRVAEGTRLLSEYGADRPIAGSNPALSAHREPPLDSFVALRP